MSEENKESPIVPVSISNAFSKGRLVDSWNILLSLFQIIFIFSVLVFNDNEYKITDAAVNLFIQI